MIDEKHQSLLVSPNDFPPGSTITPINEKTPSTDFTFLNTNTPKNHKPINNEKDKQIRESHIETIIKNDKGNTLKDSILNNLHEDIEDITNRKTESSLEKIQSIYKDELQVLRKELESKNNIINKLLETIENIGNKAVQPNPLPIPKRHLEDNSNDTNESERKEIIVPEINNTNNNQKDSQQEMNNLNLGNTNSIEKQLNDVKIKKREEYYRSKNNVQSNAAKENITTEKGQWPKNTTLIVGDSIINGVLEEGLCGGGRNVKVRNFPGATVDDLNHHIIPLLQKKPSHIIVHAGTNDAYHSTSREILNNLLSSKLLTQEKLPDCKVIISRPTLRSDNGKATLMVNQLTNHLLQLNILLNYFIKLNIKYQGFTFK